MKKWVLDMVHHNPGEKPFKTAFSDPRHLVRYGYNGQVFKHVNCLVSFPRSGVEVFPEGSAEAKWREEFGRPLRESISAAKAEGLAVFAHLDLFVLPRSIVERYAAEICDPVSGRIMLDKPFTLELHRMLFEELARQFPEIDGYIIRVGETYLHDTPHHVGNGPIPKLGEAWTPTYGYMSKLGLAQGAEAWSGQQEDAYVKLVQFLCAEVCVRHGKQLIFRTWDIFPDKLHASREHYLALTRRLPVHPGLIFSIKHTALDFWRRVRVNPCLGAGAHFQVVEVQCQREYEGKGAFPNYVMAGVMNGFEENREPLGLRTLLMNPLIKGIYGWSRGGGWYGPYIADETWPDLNAFVLGQVASGQCLDEESAFFSYCDQVLGLDVENALVFRELCLLSARAVLLGRHCEAFDAALQEELLPTACWMRDDFLGGRDQLSLVFAYLWEHSLVDAALAEKDAAVQCWERLVLLAGRIAWADEAQARKMRLSARYGLLLFRIVREGWNIMAEGFRGERTGVYSREKLVRSVERYEACWEDYRALGNEAGAPSLYRGNYFSLPGVAPLRGLDETVQYYLDAAGVVRP